MLQLSSEGGGQEEGHHWAGHGTRAHARGGFMGLLPVQDGFVRT